MNKEDFITNIVELAEKYRKAYEGEFDHQTIKIGDENVFIHFHENETEIHIVKFNK